MNIFYLHFDVKRCARYHVDKHVVKMILETLQLLCSAIWLSGYDTEPPLKLTHKNHPSAIWARSSRQNWLWLQSLGVALCDEYTFRYCKKHRYDDILRTLACPNLPDTAFVPPPQCMPDEYKHDSTVQAYRRYYYYGKARMHSWTGSKTLAQHGSRSRPSWMPPPQTLSV